MLEGWGNNPEGASWDLLPTYQKKGIRQSLHVRETLTCRYCRQARCQVHNQEGSEACRSATGRSRSRPCWAPPCLAAYPAYSPPPTSHPTWPSSKAASLSSSSSPPPRSTNQTLCWTLSHTQGFSTCLESSRDQSTLRARTTRLGLGDLWQKYENKQVPWDQSPYLPR